MKLVTFRVATPLGTFTRVGAMHGQSYVDVNMAYARWLADQREAQPYRMANAQVPVTMLEFLEGGPSTMAAARRALDYAVSLVRRQRPCESHFYHQPMFESARCPIPLRCATASPSKITLPPRQLQGRRFRRNGTKPRYTTGNHRTIIGPDEYLGHWKLRSWTMSWNWPVSLDARAKTLPNGRRRTTSPAARS